MKSILVGFTLALTAWAQPYAPADQGQHPSGGGVKILPDDFLRGYDPVTVYFPQDAVAAKANADDGGKRLKLVPDWPGAYVWVDKRTLQFRPAEPWPALARFSIEAGSARKILTTMMSAPSAMSPSPGSEGLRPFRVLTLTFPQAYPVASLKKMLTLEIRDLPGLGDSPARKVNSYALAPLPRASHRDPATWTVTLDEDVPEGRQLVVGISLALGNEGTTLWQGRASTRTPFTLTEVRCGNAVFPLVGGASTPKDLALGCGNRGDQPQGLGIANVLLDLLVAGKSGLDPRAGGLRQGQVDSLRMNLDPRWQDQGIAGASRHQAHNKGSELRFERIG